LTITITPENQNLYNNLFDDINSTIAGLNITSLKDYCESIDAIKDYVLLHKNKSYFMRLPQDEATIMIDANSRKIILPSII
jgi:hypothetical protein